MGSEYTTAEKPNLKRKKVDAVENTRRKKRPGIHACLLCNYSSDKKSRLQRHQTTHAKERPFSCPECPKAFKSKGDVDRHKKVHAKKEQKEEHPCTECKKTYPSLASLSRHKKSVHVERTKKCSVCDKLFKTVLELKAHQNIHDVSKWFKCEKCDYKTAFKANIHKHKSKHIEKKSFQCSQCLKYYKSYDSLRQHIKRHTDNRPYECAECGAAFKVKADLQQHEKWHLPPTEECPLCQKMYVTKEYLKIHLASHENKRLFTCQQCQKGFNNLTNLRTHELTHKQEKSFECEECSKKFKLRNYLVQHVKFQHTAKGAFPCPEEDCEYVSAAKGNMKRHYETQHTVEGQQVKKMQEAQCLRVLREHFIVDPNLYIQYQDCVEKPDRYNARVDAHVSDILDYTVIVEIDERQHHDYLVRCEGTRMLQIHESILAAGQRDQPLVFVRYSPKGIVRVDGKAVKIQRKDREETLVKLLNEIKEGKHKFTQPLNIIYLFYDQEKGKPCILSDSDYDKQLVACVDLSLSKYGLP